MLLYFIKSWSKRMFRQMKSYVIVTEMTIALYSYKKLKKITIVYFLSCKD